MEMNKGMRDLKMALLSEDVAKQIKTDIEDTQWELKNDKGLFSPQRISRVTYLMALNTAISKAIRGY